VKQFLCLLKGPFTYCSYQKFSKLSCKTSGMTGVFRFSTQSYTHHVHVRCMCRVLPPFFLLFRNISAWRPGKVSFTTEATTPNGGGTTHLSPPCLNQARCSGLLPVILFVSVRSTLRSRCGQTKVEVAHENAIKDTTTFLVT
jgi:hypothetical protein